MKPRTPPPEGAYVQEIVIRPDGSVAFKHLDPGLLALALALDPRDERLRAARGSDPCEDVP